LQGGHGDVVLLVDKYGHLADVLRSLEDQSDTKLYACVQSRAVVLLGQVRAYLAQRLSPPDATAHLLTDEAAVGAAPPAGLPAAFAQLLRLQASHDATPLSIWALGEWRCEGGVASNVHLFFVRMWMFTKKLRVLPVRHL
jgi:hypothetical protein